MVVADSRPRIGFLFNHDQIHQIAHSLPIALALAARDDAGGITLIAGNPRMAEELRRLAGAHLESPRLTLIELALKPLSRLVAGAFDWLAPLGKLAVYRDNLDFFAGFDVLIVAEKTSALLKTHFGLDHLKLIHTRHGAGDRAIGFDKASNNFDHVLVAGEKIAARLVDDAGLRRDKISVVGYPKFDLEVPALRETLFANPALPTVLYNPHPSPHLSSWYRHGRQILEFFANSPDYNLIFAPHIMLFHRPLVVTIDKLRILPVGRVPAAIRAAPNIHVDLGSPASADMSYAAAADLYLGDASSQVYEFIATRRPCLFVNSHDVAWRDNPDFAHWSLGPVIDNPSQLAAGLDGAFSGFDAYRPVQDAMFARTFDLTDQRSSERAAAAILAAITEPRA